MKNWLTEEWAKLMTPRGNWIYVWIPAYLINVLFIWTHWTPLFVFEAILWIIGCGSFFWWGRKSKIFWIIIGTVVILALVAALLARAFAGGT